MDGVDHGTSRGEPQRAYVRAVRSFRGWSVSEIEAFPISILRFFPSEWHGSGPGGRAKGDHLCLRVIRAGCVQGGARWPAPANPTARTPPPISASSRAKRARIP